MDIRKLLPNLLAEGIGRSKTWDFVDLGMRYKLQIYIFDLVFFVYIQHYKDTVFIESIMF